VPSPLQRVCAVGTREARKLFATDSLRAEQIAAARLEVRVALSESHAGYAG
jgi:hypothetical protein